jgi:hypothetical protein
MAVSWREVILFTLTGLVVAIATPIVTPLIAMYQQPDLRIDIAPTQIDEQVIRTKVTVANIGQSAAHNLRLTFSSNTNLTGYEVEFTSEELTLKQDDSPPNTIVGLAPRLVRGAEFSILALQNGSLSDISSKAFVTYDEGSKQQLYPVSVPETDTDSSTFEIVINIVAPIIAVLATYLLRDVQRRAGEPKLTVMTDKTEYRTGDTITVRGRVKGVKVEQPLLLRVVSPNGIDARIDQVPINSDGSFSSPFGAGGLMNVNGPYTVIVSYRNYLSAATFNFQV